MGKQNCKRRKEVKRRDAENRVLKTGESQRSDGRYMFRWTESGARKCVYGNTLQELREEEDKIQRNRFDGIKTADKMTMNDVYNSWLITKSGLRKKTLWNYKTSYSRYAQSDIGEMPIQKIRKSDILKFYNRLLDERGLSIGTVDGLHTVIGQVLQFAVDDGLIRNNPGYHVIGDIKRARGYHAEKRRALTWDEETAFLDYVLNTPKYVQFYPLFVFLFGTGCRIGEAIGLRHDDVDIENLIIDINHTMVLVRKDGCPQFLAVTPPKTADSKRIIPMFDEVADALRQEEKNQQERGLRCETSVDGYTDFIFLNKSGKTYSGHYINTVIKRIVADYNNAEKEASEAENREALLLPDFSCHQCRHTFATRYCENEPNAKAVQVILGHSDYRTTMNIYAEIGFPALKKSAERMKGKLIPTPKSTPNARRVI